MLIGMPGQKSCLRKNTLPPATRSEVFKGSVPVTAGRHHFIGRINKSVWKKRFCLLVKTVVKTTNRVDCLPGRQRHASISAGMFLHGVPSFYAGWRLPADSWHMTAEYYSLLI